VTKLRGGASGLIEDLVVPAAASSVLLHVRDYTKGHPEVAANNHPIRHRGVVGVHNGVIENDDDLLRRHGISRADPEMTVDSEAIFALMYQRRHDPRSLSELRGTMAAAWMDEREAGIFLARGRLRPLWVGRSGSDLFFASTRRALAIVEAVVRARLVVHSVAEGRFLRVREGRVVEERRFRPGRGYREDSYLPPVRAPGEALTCLERLASLSALG
jgi:asparagine synthetase B (glutamine-hydrolysing)